MDAVPWRGIVPCEIWMLAGKRHCGAGLPRPGPGEGYRHGTRVSGKRRACRGSPKGKPEMEHLRRPDDFPPIVHNAFRYSSILAWRKGCICG
jgi:hypothetical protein